jgi:hypothetical protein
MSRGTTVPVRYHNNRNLLTAPTQQRHPGRRTAPVHNPQLQYLSSCHSLESNCHRRHKACGRCGRPAFAQFSGLGGCGRPADELGIRAILKWTADDKKWSSTCRSRVVHMPTHIVEVAAGIPGPPECRDKLSVNPCGRLRSGHDCGSGWSAR